MDGTRFFSPVERLPFIIAALLLCQLLLAFQPAPLHAQACQPCQGETGTYCPPECYGKCCGLNYICTAPGVCSSSGFPPTVLPTPYTTSSPEPIATNTPVPTPTPSPTATPTAIPPTPAPTPVPGGENPDGNPAVGHQPRPLPPQGWPNGTGSSGNGGGVGVSVPVAGGGTRFEVQESNAESMSLRYIERYPDDLAGLGVASFLAGFNILVQVVTPADLSGRLLHYVVLTSNGATENFTYGEPFSCIEEEDHYLCDTRIEGWAADSGPLVAVREMNRVASGAAFLYDGFGALVVSRAAGPEVDWQDPGRIVKNVGGTSCVTLGSGAERLNADFLAGTGAQSFEFNKKKYALTTQDFLTLIYRYQIEGFQKLKPFSEYEFGVRFSLGQPDDSQWWTKEADGMIYPADPQAPLEADLCDRDGKAVFPTLITPEPLSAGFLGLVFDNARIVYLAPSAKTPALMHEYGHSLCQLDDEYLLGPLSRWSSNCAVTGSESRIFPEGLSPFGPPFFQGCRDMSHSRASATGLMRNPFEDGYHSPLGEMLCQGVLEYYGAEKRL